MTSRYRCCLIILFWSCCWNFWKPVFVMGKLVGFGRPVLPWSSDSSPISWIMSSAGGGRMSSRGWELRPPRIGIWAAAVPSACWPRYMTQKSIGLLNLIDACTHPAAVVLLKIGVTLWVYRPPSPLASSRQPQSCRIFLLGSGRPATAAFMIDKMVILTIDVTIRIINSLCSSQGNENSWALFSPTLFPAISGST